MGDTIEVTPRAVARLGQADGQRNAWLVYWMRSTGENCRRNCSLAYFAPHESEHHDRDQDAGYPELVVLEGGSEENKAGEDANSAEGKAEEEDDPDPDNFHPDDSTDARTCARDDETDGLCKHDVCPQAESSAALPR